MWRQIRRNPKVQTLVRLIVDFCSHNSTHITPHYARRDQQWWDLLFWFTMHIVFGIVVYFSLDYLQTMYDEKNTGIELSVDYVKFVSTVPAFTFCPEPVFDKQLLAEFLQRQEELYGVKRQDTLRLLELLMGISFLPVPVMKYYIDRKDYMQLRGNLTQRGYVERLDGVQAAEIVIDAGICYTFNSRLAEAVDVFLYTDLGQKLPRFRNATPTFDYYDNFPIFFKFRHNFTGKVRLYIHSPDELPTWWTRPSAITEPGQNLRVAFDMKELTYEEDVITKSPLRNRKCRTRDESNLMMYPKTYSRHLCLIDCRMRQTLDKCGCVPFFYANRELRGKSWNLDCLPNCARLDVNVFDPTIKGMRPLTQMRLGVASGNGIGAVLMYPPIRQTRRRILFSFTDYIVSFGNLLSLLEGNNLLTGLETAFYLTMRLYWFFNGYTGAVAIN